MKAIVRILLVSIFASCSIFFYSCQKDSLEMQPESSPSYAHNETNDALQTLTNTFIEAVNSNSFCEELKKEALIEWEPDYIAKKLKSSETDNQIIKILKNYTKNPDIEKLQELVSKIPNYEVSIPVHCEEWDPKTYTPLIAFIPSDFNEKIHKQIKAFNNKGEVVWLGTNTDPDLPVILIRPKEEIDLTKYSPDNGLSLKTARIDGATEFIKSMNTPDISAVESWLSGPRCEIKVVTISSLMNGIWSIDFFNPRRDDINNSWYTTNHIIGQWNTQTIGHYLTMQWYEEDGGGTVTTSVSYKTESGITSTIGYSVKDDDDNLGQKFISYSDVVGQEYNTGRMKWKMHNSTYCPIIGSWDGAHCYVGTPPSGRTAYVSNNKFYYTANFNQWPVCPISGSYYDGIDCLYMTAPSGTSPFVYNNAWYVEPYSF